MPHNKPGSRLIKAAGGVAWRPGPDGEPEILLVHRKKYGDWSLPKGKTEPGEPLPVAAVREVLEEGGARLALGRRLASVRYNVSGRPKRVHYWAARVVSVDKRAVPNHEVDEVTWLPAADAVDKVSYPRDLGVLAEFAARPAGTVPLILLRHAKATAKGGWKRGDATRPLDDSGRADAKALADLLACFAPHPRLISSPAARCLETLRPFAQLTGAPVHEEPSLYIHHRSSGTEGADSVTDIPTLIRDVIASGEPTVICAHRENIPALREAALATLVGHPGTANHRGSSGSDASGLGLLSALAELPADWDDTLPTSGFWVLNVAPLPLVKDDTDADQPTSAAATSAASGVGPEADQPRSASSDVARSAPLSADQPMAADSRSTAELPLLAQPPVPEADQAPPLRARRWWQRLFARPGRLRDTPPPAPALPVDSPGTGSAVVNIPASQAPVTDEPPDATATDCPASEAPSETVKLTKASPVLHPAEESGPVGVLVSADRYDLSEP